MGSIIISGSCFTNKPQYPNFGDIYIYRKSDSAGSYARSGRHTNYGYSGNYWATIFDGKSWKNLNLTSIFYNTHYDQQSETNCLERQISVEISRKQNMMVTRSTTREYFHL